MTDSIPTPVFDDPEDAFAWLHDYETKLGAFERDCLCHFEPGQIRPSRISERELRFFVVIPIRSTRPGCQVHCPMIVRVRRPRWAVWRPKVEVALTSDEAIEVLFAGRRFR